MASDSDQDKKRENGETASRRPIGRRTLIKTGLATVPVMLTLRGRPLQAATGGGTLGDYNGYDGGYSKGMYDNPYDNMQPYGEPYWDPANPPVQGTGGGGGRGRGGGGGRGTR